MNINIDTLALDIIEKAKEKKKSIVASESITGGRIASALTSVSGSSEVFSAGVVCYSEHAKIHASGVDVRDLREYGVYSEIIAMQMAERTMKRNIADIGISTTGCAEGICKNTGKNSEIFPRGKVIFALSQRDKKTQVFEKIFEGNRKEVQEKATFFALQKIEEALQKK